MGLSGVRKGDLEMLYLMSEVNEFGFVLQKMALQELNSFIYIFRNLLKFAILIIKSSGGKGKVHLSVE